MKGYKKATALVFIITLLISGGDGKQKNCDCTKKVLGATVGGVGLVAAVGYGVLALGFGPAGIAAGSIASSLMSAATTYGVGSAAIGAAQSIGAAGMAIGTKAAVGTVGAAAGYYAAGDDCDCPC